MQYIVKINRNACSACGACLIYPQLFKEMRDGKAEIVRLKILSNKEIQDVLDAKNICMDNAISLLEMNGTGNLKDIISIAEKKLLSLTIPKAKDINFNADLTNFDYKIDMPYLDIYYTSYKSYNKAIDASLKAFDNYVYQHRDKIIMSLLHEFKVRNLGSYYLLRGNSVFDDINYKVCGLLKKLKYELFVKSSWTVKLPDDYFNVEIYPDTHCKKNTWEDVSRFETHLYPITNVDRDFVKNSSYTSLRDYKDYLDVREYDTYDDKTVWEPQFPNEALEEIVKDLKLSLKCSDVREIAEQHVNRLLEEFEKALQAYIKGQIETARQCI